MKSYRQFLLALALLFCTPALSQATGPDLYAQTIETFKASPEVQKYFKTAYGYAGPGSAALTAKAWSTMRARLPAGSP